MNPGPVMLCWGAGAGDGGLGGVPCCAELQSRALPLWFMALVVNAPRLLGAKSDLCIHALNLMDPWGL